MKTKAGPSATEYYTTQTDNGSLGIKETEGSDVSLPFLLQYFFVWVLPDTDLQFTVGYTASPELRYAINFATTGVYTVWLRGYAPNAAGDSVYIGLDGQSVNDNWLTGFTPRTWDWANESSSGVPLALNLDQSGIHTLHLWIREDGLQLDRVLLTTDVSYNPIGNGPVESVSQLPEINP